MPVLADRRLVANRILTDRQRRVLRFLAHAPSNSAVSIGEISKTVIAKERTSSYPMEAANRVVKQLEVRGLIRRLKSGIVITAKGRKRV